MAPSTGYSILITEAELESIFARVRRLHGSTYNVAKPKDDDDRDGNLAIHSHIHERTNEGEIGRPSQGRIGDSNEALQRVLDDVRDGLQGLVSRTELDRFLDDLERENAVLSARWGDRYRQVMDRADEYRYAAGGATQGGDGDEIERSSPEHCFAFMPSIMEIWPWGEELGRWITRGNNSSISGTATGDCRWLPCVLPEQVVAFIRTLPQSWRENLIFATPVYINDDVSSTSSPEKNKTGLESRLHHERAQGQPPTCDKPTAFAMLLVDLIGALSARAADAEALSGFRKADLPNIRGPEGKIQALVMVLDMCLKALPQCRGKQKRNALAAARGVDDDDDGDGDSSGDAKDPNSAGVEKGNQDDKKNSEKQQPLLLLIDRIDSVVCPETEHYVKKTVLLFKEACSAASSSNTTTTSTATSNIEVDIKTPSRAGRRSAETATPMTTRSKSLISRFHRSRRGLADGPPSHAASLGRSSGRDDSLDGGSDAAGQIRVLFLIPDDKGRAFLESTCGVSPVVSTAKVDEADKDLPKPAANHHDTHREQPTKKSTGRSQWARGYTMIRLTQKRETRREQEPTPNSDNQIPDQGEEEGRVNREQTQGDSDDDVGQDLWAFKPPLLASTQSPTVAPGTRSTALAARRRPLTLPLPLPLPLPLSFPLMLNIHKHKHRHKTDKKKQRHPIIPTRPPTPSPFIPKTNRHQHRHRYTAPGRPAYWLPLRPLDEVPESSLSPISPGITTDASSTTSAQKSTGGGAGGTGGAKKRPTSLQLVTNHHRSTSNYNDPISAALPSSPFLFPRQSPRPPVLRSPLSPSSPSPLPSSPAVVPEDCPRAARKILGFPLSPTSPREQSTPGSGGGGGGGVIPQPDSAPRRNERGGSRDKISSSSNNKTQTKPKRTMPLAAQFARTRQRWSSLSSSSSLSLRTKATIPRPNSQTTTTGITDDLGRSTAALRRMSSATDLLRRIPLGNRYSLGGKLGG